MQVDSDVLLASSWVDPTSAALTVVLVNPGATGIDVALDVGDESWASPEVTRTAFDGVERSTPLGALSSERVLHLPEHSIATVSWLR